MLAKIWSNRNSPTLMVGMQNGTATLEESSVISYKTKHTFAIRSSNHTPWYLHKWNEDLYLHKNLHMSIYNSFNYNCQNMKASKMFFSTWRNKQTVVHPTAEYYSILKRKELSCHVTTRWNLKCTLLSETCQTAKATYCMIPTIWHSTSVEMIIGFLSFNLLICSLILIDL